MQGHVEGASMRVPRALAGKAPGGVPEQGHCLGPQLDPRLRQRGVGDCQHCVLRTSHPVPIVAAWLAVVPRHRGTLHACALQPWERGYPLFVVQAHMQGGLSQRVDVQQAHQPLADAGGVGVATHSWAAPRPMTAMKSSMAMVTCMALLR